MDLNRDHIVNYYNDKQVEKNFFNGIRFILIKDKWILHKD
jgi:hypothetical protein